MTGTRAIDGMAPEERAIFMRCLAAAALARALDDSERETTDSQSQKNETPRLQRGV